MNYGRKSCNQQSVTGFLFLVINNYTFLISLFTDNLTKVKSSMEALVAKKRNESQMLQMPKKLNPFPPSPVIIWIQQGIYYYYMAVILYAIYH